MKIKLLVVGDKMPNWVEQASAHYLKLLQRFCSLELTAITAANASQKLSVDEIKKQEANKISEHLNKDSHLILLDQQGKQPDNQQLATQLEHWKMLGKTLCFIIGGSFGLHQQLKAQADFTWSLSSLTLPHALARVVLLEQLYRSFSICNNHPYHK